MSQEDIDMLASEETISRLAPAVLDVAISSALEGGHVIKASPGRLYSLTVRIDSTLASGTYYLQLHNSAGVASEGAHAFLEAPTKVQHEQGYDDFVSKDSSRGGVYASLGIYACISSTEFTKTLVASAASFSAEYA
jgi:hypothetical protein